jgi:hypothetical protein
MTIDKASSVLQSIFLFELFDFELGDFVMSCQKNVECQWICLDTCRHLLTFYDIESCMIITQILCFTIKNDAVYNQIDSY